MEFFLSGDIYVGMWLMGRCVGVSACGYVSRSAYVYLYVLVCMHESVST